MNDWTVLRTGMAGVVIAAICCATPVLAVVLGALGLGAWLGWTAYVVVPLLAFVGLTAYALARRERREHGHRGQDG